MYKADISDIRSRGRIQRRNRSHSPPDSSESLGRPLNRDNFCLWLISCTYFTWIWLIIKLITTSSITVLQNKWSMIQNWISPSRNLTTCVDKHWPPMSNLTFWPKQFLFEFPFSFSLSIWECYLMRNKDYVKWLLQGTKMATNSEWSNQLFNVSKSINCGKF